MPTTLAKKALDKSPFYVTVSYFDEDGAAVTPSSVTWSLYGPDKSTVINSRTDVVIATPGTSNTIALTGADTAYASGNKRYLKVKYVYTDSEAVEQTAYDHVVFLVDDVAGVT